MRLKVKGRKGGLKLHVEEKSTKVGLSREDALEEKSTKVGLSRKDALEEKSTKVGLSMEDALF